MTSSESKTPKPWTAVYVKELRLLMKLKRPVAEIAETLGRSPQAIRAKIASLSSARKASSSKKGAKKAAKKAVKKPAKKAAKKAASSSKKK